MSDSYRASYRPQATPPWRRYVWLVLALILVLVVVKLRHGKAKVVTAPVDTSGNEFTVFLQPGGGGSELNYQWPPTGTPTLTGKELNLRLANVIKDVLAKEGIQGVLSRDTNDGFVDAIDRSQRADQIKASLSVAVYVGSDANTGLRGWQLIDYKKPDWDDTFKNHQDFARALEQDLGKRLVGANAMSEQQLSTRNSVLTPDMPTVVLVWGMLSNDADRALMQSEDYLYAVANGVTDAAVEYRDKLQKATPRTDLPAEAISGDTYAPF